MKYIVAISDGMSISQYVRTCNNVRTAIVLSVGAFVVEHVKGMSEEELSILLLELKDPMRKVSTTLAERNLVAISNILQIVMS